MSEPDFMRENSRHADTPEAHVDQAVNGVADSVQRLADLTQRWPHLLGEQLSDIECANVMLSGIVLYLEAWQEAQKQLDEPANLLGAG